MRNVKVDIDELFGNRSDYLEISPPFRRNICEMYFDEDLVDILEIFLTQILEGRPLTPLTVDFEGDVLLSETVAPDDVLESIENVLVCFFSLFPDTSIGKELIRVASLADGHGRVGTVVLIVGD